MPSLHLFVDTNIFLSFFAFASDDIEQLKKLEGLIESDKLKLYVPDQVAQEFARNRENKLAKSIEEFAVKGSTSLPRFLVDLEEAAAYREAVKSLEKSRNDLVQKARENAAARSFAVDGLVSSLMAKAGIGAITTEMIEKARLRRDVGNPPGKHDTLGDQINWVYLLETVEAGVTLHVVSKDGDYQSAFKNGKPHQFLVDEWKAQKNGDLCLHKELKPFLNAHFEIIQLEIDKEKAAAVDNLVEAGSFSMTHNAISQLNPFFDALSLEDATKLIRAGLENNQIRWISSDGDVRHFYTKLLDTFAGQFDFGLEAEADDVFRAKPPAFIDQLEDEVEEVPF